MSWSSSSCHSAGKNHASTNSRRTNTTFSPTTVSSAVQAVSLTQEVGTTDSIEAQRLTPRECTLTSPLDIRPPCPIVYYQPQWQCSTGCPIQVPPHTVFCCRRVCNRLSCGNSGLPVNTVNCSPAHLVANGQERNEKDNCERHSRRPLTFKNQKKPSEEGRKLPRTANASDSSKIPPAKSSPKLSVKRTGSQQPLKSRSQPKVKIGKDELLDAKRQDGRSVRTTQERSYLARTRNAAQGSGSLRGSVRPKETFKNLSDLKGLTRSEQSLHAGRSSRDEKRDRKLQLPEQTSAAPVDDGAKQRAQNSLHKDEEEVPLGNQAAVWTANKPEDHDEVGEMEQYEVTDDDKKGEEADVEYENEEGVAKDNLVKLGSPTSDYDPPGKIHVEIVPSPEENNPVEGHRSSQEGETLEGITVAFRDSNSIALLSETTELDDLTAFEELMDKSVILSEDSKIDSHALSVKSEKSTDIDAVRRRMTHSRSSDEAGSRNMSSTASGLSERATTACHLLRQRVNDVYHMTTKATSVNLRESASHLVSFVQNQARAHRATVTSTPERGNQKTASTISHGITARKDSKKIKDTTGRRKSHSYGTSMASMETCEEMVKIEKLKPRSSADKPQEMDTREQESVRSLSGSGLSARSYSHPGEARTTSKVQAPSPVAARGGAEASVERMTSYKSLPRVASTGSDKKSQAERTSREVEKSSMTKSQGFGSFRKAPKSSADKPQEMDTREQESVRSLSGSGLSARSYSHPGEGRTTSKVQAPGPVAARGGAEASVERMTSYKSLPRVASTGSDKKSQAERTSREVEKSSMTKSQGFGSFRKAPRSSADKPQEMDSTESAKGLFVQRVQQSVQSVKRMPSAAGLSGKSSLRLNEVSRPVDSSRSLESTKRSSDKSNFPTPPRDSSRKVQSNKASTVAQKPSFSKARHQDLPPESSSSVLKKPLIRTPSSGAAKSSTKKSQGFSLLSFSRRPQTDASQLGGPGTPKNASVSREEPSVRGRDRTKGKQQPTPSSRSPKSSLSSDPVSQSRSTTRSSSPARTSGSQSESSARGSRTPAQAKKPPAPSVRRPKSSSSLSASRDYSGPAQSNSPATKVSATARRGLRSLSSGSLSTEQIADVCSPLVKRVRSNVEKVSMRLRKSIRHLGVTLQHTFGDQPIWKDRNRTRSGGAPKPSPKKSNIDKPSGRKLTTSPIKTSSLSSQRGSSEVSDRDQPPVKGRKPVQSKVAHPTSVTSNLEDRTQSEDHDSKRVAPHSGSDRVQEKRPTAPSSVSSNLMNMLKKRWTSLSFGGAQKTPHVRDRTRSHSIQRELVIRLVRLTRSLSVRMRDLRQKATPLTQRIGRSGKRYATQAAIRVYELRALYPPLRARVVSTVEQMKTMARASSEKAPNVVQSCILRSRVRVLKLRGSSEEVFARTRAKLERIEDPISRQVSREEFDELQQTVKHIHREVHLECEQIKSLLRRSRAMRKKAVVKESVREAPKTKDTPAPVPESDNDFVTREEFNNLENGLKTLSRRIHEESGNIRMLLGEALKRRNKTSARWKSVALGETKYGDHDDGKEEAAGASPSEGPVVTREEFDELALTLSDLSRRVRGENKAFKSALSRYLASRNRMPPGDVWSTQQEETMEESGAEMLAKDDFSQMQATLHVLTKRIRQESGNIKLLLGETLVRQKALIP
nr:unnamed protein product [Spirometra erinaceieuropaei]